MALPVAGAMLIPKCPVCLAGYVAAATGIGVPMLAAGLLRYVLLSVCLGSFVYFATHRRA